jgi:hypothetical protein
VMRQAALALLLPIACSVLGVRVSIVEGESMAPTIRAGDTVVTVSPLLGAPIAGSVLLVESEGRRLLHRLARYDGASLWMKGDASVSGDSRPVRESDVLGTLAIVFPTSHLYRAVRVAAQFTSEIPISMNLASAAGVFAEQGPRYTFGADAQGRLLPGGYALWSLLLSACVGASGACSGSYALRIDAQGFSSALPPAGSAGSPSQALARSLRVTTRCQEVGGSGAWTQMSDLLTAEWSAANIADSILAVHAGAVAQAGVRCEVKATLLGAVPASGGVLTLPLIWGPA